MSDRVSDFLAKHPVFTHEEFAAVRGAARSRRTVDSLLTYHMGAGHVVNVRRGLYAAVPPGRDPATYQVDPYLVASKLCPDAVVALHAALQYRGKVYSVWNHVSVMSEARMRPLEFQGTTFERVPPTAPLEHPLVVEEPHAGGTVRVATLERTMVDVLAAPKPAGGWEEVWRSLEMVEFFELDALTRYALELDNPMTVSRVGFYLEQHREALFVDDRQLEALQAGALSAPRYLDASREPGRLVKPWNLIVPQWVLDRSWGEVA